ncbi:cytochrome c oxidase subunit 3 [Actinopolymorpha singaporensis]|uniref:cytochrome-c oxidase n=1 Tax=Actinopolymorpha singaporensis TaxID=117157 RepID=A0A1H1TKC7_9ACTN|nr:cytochrome c oxidase subunit 3 [Actinopolymorpha singaporensis]SDS60531.1 cytochrome c oxidase subunit 3 [Actinopolymorpha singaporensis]
MTTVDTPTGRGVRRGAVQAPEAPVGRTTGWWGMVLFIATESATFGAFVASYFYLRFVHGGPWPPKGDTLPDLVLPSIQTGILVLSTVPMAAAVRAARRGARGLLWLTMLVVALSGTAFVVLQGLDYVSEWPDSTISKDTYGSLFYTLTGLHGLHVMGGIGMIVVLLLSASVGRIGRRRPEPVGIVSLYWYFLAVVAVAVYCTVYISPYL